MQNEPIRVTKAQFCAHAEAYLDLAETENRQINIGVQSNHGIVGCEEITLVEFVVKTGSQSFRDSVATVGVNAIPGAHHRIVDATSHGGMSGVNVSAGYIGNPVLKQTGVTGGYRLEQLPVIDDHGWILNRLVGWRPNQFGCECRIEVAVSEHAKFTQNELTLRVLAMPLGQGGPMLGAYIVIPRAWTGYDSDVFRDALLKMLNRDGAFVSLPAATDPESEFSIPRLEIPKD